MCNWTLVKRLYEEFDGKTRPPLKGDKLDLPQDVTSPSASLGYRRWHSRYLSTQDSPLEPTKGTCLIDQELVQPPSLEARKNEGTTRVFITLTPKKNANHRFLFMDSHSDQRVALFRAYAVNRNEKTEPSDPRHVIDFFPQTKWVSRPFFLSWWWVTQWRILQTQGHTVVGTMQGTDLRYGGYRAFFRTTIPVWYSQKATPVRDLSLWAQLGNLHQVDFRSSGMHLFVLTHDLTSQL